MVLVAVLGLGLAGVSPPPALAVAPASGWPQLGGDPSHRGSDQPSTITPANVSTLELAWHADTGNAQSPIVVGGVVYAGVDQRLYAFPTICSREPTCEPLWRTVQIAMTSVSPAVAGGVLYAGSIDHQLYAFDAAGVQGCSGVPRTCAPLWTAGTGAWIPSSPVVANGRVYVGSGDSKLYAFDAAGVTNCGGAPKTCGPMWTGLTGGSIHSTPAVSGGTVYVGSDDGRLYAFDAAGVTNCAGMPTSCDALWTTIPGNNFSGSPTVVGDVVYVEHGVLEVYDAAGVVNCAGSPKVCTPMWIAQSGGFSGSPAVSSGVVYVAGYERTLSAYDAAGVANCSGSPKLCTPLWTALTSTERWSTSTSSPVVVNGLVFMANGIGDHYVHAFDAGGVTNCSGTPRSCTPLWSGDIGSESRTSSPAAAGNYLYVGTERDGLKVFGLPTSTDGAFHPAGPYRVLDTRTDGGALPAGQTRSLTLAGRAQLPATGMSSVVLNVAVTEPSGAGWMTVFPSGTVRPLAASINFAAGQTVSNLVVAKLGPNGAVDIYNDQGRAQVVVDVEGWFGTEGSSPGSRYTPLTPARVLDTRLSAALGPKSTLTVPVGGVGGVPAASGIAVVLNVTTVEPSSQGWLTMFPTGTSRPLASSGNFGPGQIVSNKVVVALGDGWMVDIYNEHGSTNVVVDVEGWFGFPGSAPGAPYQPVVPARILDTRFSGPIASNGTLTVPVAGLGGVPATGVTAVVLNVAVTEPTALGYLTVFPAGEAHPFAASTTYAQGQTVSNAVFAKVGADGKVQIFAASATHVVVDVEGWFG
jgi:outer membrane protein assembly factor BamB